MRKCIPLKNNYISESELIDRKISFSIIFQFCMLITNYTIKHVLNISNTSIREIISLIFMLIVGVLFFKNLHEVFERIGRLFIWTYGVFIFIFLINILIYNENIRYIKESSFWFFLICLPVGLYYIAIEDKIIFFNMLIKSAYYQMTLGIIFITTTSFDGMIYDMVFSYQILVPIIILSLKLYNKFNLLDFILVTFGLTSIIMIGSRGPLLSFLLFFILLLLINLTKHNKGLKSIFVSIFSLSVISFVFRFSEEIIYRVWLILLQFGINSRTLYILMNKHTDFLTGRSSIYSLTISKLWERPILGYGLVGDRIFLDGTYPHNIFLEILFQFGIILGLFILIVFLFYWIKGIFFARSKVERDLAVMFFGIGLVQLFVSGTYIESSNFWLFMAICFDSIKLNKALKSMDYAY